MALALGFFGAADFAFTFFAFLTAMPDLLVRDRPEHSAACLDELPQPGVAPA
ncbi:hypothetical protein AAG565_03055 [Fontimonas sp. SYSU GA230001]